MDKSRIWELIKINILYSNPQSLTMLRKQQAKKKKKNFSAYKRMMRSQLLQILLFSVLYIFVFGMIDFVKYPGYFTFYMAIFTLMAMVNAFIAMYSVFYESNDVKTMVYLPVKPRELYLAKFVSTLGQGMIFLMPLLTLLLITYWRLIGPLGILLGLVSFALLFLTTMTLALWVNSFIGRIIVRSAHRKLISTVLMTLATFGAVIPILFLNMTPAAVDGLTLVDRPIIPYFRGFYDIAVAPFSSASLLNFWLPLVLVDLMIAGIFIKVMPTYYQEVLYQGVAKVKKASKAKASAKPESLKRVMVKHHLSTLQQTTLVTNTYMMPLLYVIMFMVPIINDGARFSHLITWQYFGVAFLLGCLIGSICATPMSFIGVGISLERANFHFIKTLPFSFKAFLKEKFMLLLGAQVIVPLIVYGLVGLVVLKLPILVVLACLAGMVSMSIIQGQFMFKRDYKHLETNWQEVTQLFNRGSGQWLVFGLVFGNMILGTILIGISIVLAQAINVLAVNISLLALLAILLASLQWTVNRQFWRQLD